MTNSRVAFQEAAKPKRPEPAEKKQLRCRSQLHGIVKSYPNGLLLLEVRCKNKLCVARRSGIIVLHYFNVETGELDHTKRFRDPNWVKE